MWFKWGSMVGYCDKFQFDLICLYYIKKGKRKEMGSCQKNPNPLTQLATTQSQPHLLQHWQNLPSSTTRRTFQAHLQQLNLSQAIKTYKNSNNPSRISSSSSSHSSNTQPNSPLPIFPLPTSTILPLPEDQVLVRRQEVEDHMGELEEVGLGALASGEGCVFVMAGGLGCQLGIDKPIGVYDLGLDSACALFQILVYRLKYLCGKCGLTGNKQIKLYIMTNTQNKDAIKNYFKQNSYFHYGQDNIFFFSQPVQPVFSQDGKLVLKSQEALYLAPRGNGCIYQQIKQKNLLTHLQARNIKYCYLCPINNLLERICDPVGLGYLVKNQIDLVATCFQSNQNCFGYYGVDDKGRVQVQEQKLEEGKRKWANTGSCWMALSFLKSLLNNQQFLDDLQNYHHIMRQPPTYRTPTSNSIPSSTLSSSCSAPQTLFLQCFYHQSYSYTSRIKILQIARQQQMAPIKYKGTGKYSMGDAKQKLWAWHRKILKDAGIQVKNGAHLQIHPSIVYDNSSHVWELVRQRVGDHRVGVGLIK